MASRIFFSVAADVLDLFAPLTSADQRPPLLRRRVSDATESEAVRSRLVALAGDAGG
jgi:hypothetical protein